jgi:hypothetical protein
VTATATVTVTLADADFVESACETAVTVTVAGLGIFAGAVYTPAAEIDPAVATFPPVTPFTSQVTDVFMVFVTVARKAAVPFTGTRCVVGETETVTAGGGGEPPQLGNTSADSIVSAASRMFHLPMITPR